eukprot:TRINITY_DN506_c1_g1_i1.p1 TRINITY_DN506_c1_g1~~TRINITY_DN506_c1_g1_i1.p1  ORF type:complete len:228 (+),score=64.22 TRINITY_DN506_c1_g1_i1:242-925(+)
MASNVAAAARRAALSAVARPLLRPRAASSTQRHFAQAQHRLREPIGSGALHCVRRHLCSEPAQTKGEEKPEEQHNAFPDEPPPPPPNLITGPTDEVKDLCDQLLELSVIDFIQFMKLYQRRTGLTDEMVNSYGQANGGGGGGGGGAAAAAEAPKEEKSIFDVKLVSFDAKAKIKVIKEVRTVTGLGLKEAKDLVEGAPKILKREMAKADAEKLLKAFKDIGAECTMD